MGVSHESRIFCLLYNIDKNGLKWKKSGSNAVKVAFRKLEKKISCYCKQTEERRRKLSTLPEVGLGNYHL